jgi:hypothetical protein
MRDFLPQPARHLGGREMRCDNQPHRFYRGVDLHARSPDAHFLDAKGQTVFRPRF